MPMLGCLAFRPWDDRVDQRLLGYAGLFAGLAVIAGAFGAHSLKQSLSPAMLNVWHTAVNYQMWHALGLGLLALQTKPLPVTRWCSRLFLAGIGLFSGSLYLLALTDLRWLGMITPAGGLAFIAAWLLLSFSAWRNHGT